MVASPTPVRRPMLYRFMLCYDDDGTETLTLGLVTAGNDEEAMDAGYRLVQAWTGRDATAEEVAYDTAAGARCPDAFFTCEQLDERERLAHALRDCPAFAQVGEWGLDAIERALANHWDMDNDEGTTCRECGGNAPLADRPHKDDALCWDCYRFLYPDATP